ncbi:MAG TPA: hypothetical protein EYN91_19580 [Candidatus Melainabacteria bacterium]|jgi:hypothetical protein|nr:hypothetical protein [Candidatus Melainabacteria bacterium]
MGILRSKFFISVALFAAVSSLLAMFKVGNIAPTDFPIKTWTGWAVDEFLSDKQGRPHFVFLGSSLVLVPVAGVDADYLKHPIDGSHHHNSQYFEDQFKRHSNLKVKTFNFGLPGEMPSDAFLITKFLLKGEKRPDVIVYGVGPRDFMDSLLPSPAATDPYQYLSRFGDVTSHRHLIAPEWDQRLNFELAQFIYPYGHSYDMSVSSERAMTAAINEWIPKPQTDKPFTIQDRRTLFPHYKQMEITSNEAFFRPTTPETRTFDNANLNEYKKRYSRLNWRTFCHQMKFLADLMNTARERGTQVVLISMPITDINRDLLEKGTWDSYKKSLKVLAQSKDATFIDLGDSKQFSTSDFMDTVHLHSGGGMKLLDIVAERAAKDRRVMSALDPTNSHIAGLKGGQL